jgi:7-carboxy-7-deazaguanine synthase
MIPLHHILHTLLGESTRAGARCALVRTHGCNLACRWCDTPQQHVVPRELDVDAITRIVRETAAPLALITGGEPLLHGEVPLLCRALLDQGLAVMVETNGSKDVSTLPPGVLKIMDLKPPSSGFEGSSDPGNVERLDGKDEIKIVIADRGDYLWARDMVLGRLGRFRGAISLSPLHGGGLAGNVAQWILEDRLSVRINLQIHRILFPAGEHEVF